MKTVLTILAVAGLLSLESCVTYKTVSFTEKENLSDVYEDIPGTKDQLYLKANRWMVETFTNAKSVIQHQDKEAGAIIGRYLMGGEITLGGRYTPATNTEVYAIIELQVKDGKGKIMIRPQSTWTYPDPAYQTPPFKASMSKEQVLNDMKILSSSFYKSLMKPDSGF